MRKALAVAAVSFLVACAVGQATYGVDLDGFRALEAGKATKSDVLSMAGAPTAKTRVADGREAWIYVRAEARSNVLILPFYGRIDTTSKSRSAVLTFREDVLEGVEWKD